MKRKESAFWVVQALIVVGVLALVSLPAQPASETASTTIGEGPLVFTSPISEQALQLRVVLNSSVLPANGTLGAHIEVYNTLDANVSLAVGANQDVSEWSGADFVCGWNPTVVGFALFEGDVSLENLSEAGHQLELVPPFYPLCAGAAYPPANVTFFPHSEQTHPSGVAAMNATTEECTPSGPEGLGLGCGQGTGLVGYWNYSVSAPGSLDYGSRALVHFPPGEYTLVAADDWNQYVFATFVVQPPEASSSSSSSAAVANTVVATVTVTTTLTTHAQATTSTAITCINTMPTVTTTAVTTSTVGAGSTTTTTVTTTSTSYARTVTVNGCPPTFLATVTRYVHCDDHGDPIGGWLRRPCRGGVY